METITVKKSDLESLIKKSVKEAIIEQREILFDSVYSASFKQRNE